MSSFLPFFHTPFLSILHTTFQFPSVFTTSLPPFIFFLLSIDLSPFPFTLSPFFPPPFPTTFLPSYLPSSLSLYPSHHLSISFCFYHLPTTFHLFPPFYRSLPLSLHPLSFLPPPFSNNISPFLSSLLAFSLSFTPPFNFLLFLPPPYHLSSFPPFFNLSPSPSFLPSPFFPFPS